MHIQLMSLAVLALFLSFSWVPGAILRIAQFGMEWPYIQLDDTAGRPLIGAGRRLELAWRHLLLNFSPFGATVMILAKLDISDPWTQAACLSFVAFRFAHYLLYAWDFPQSRALAYFGSLLALFYLSGRAIAACSDIF